MNAVITVISNGEIHKYNGSFSKGRLRHRLCYTDENDAVISIMLQQGNIHINRNDKLLSHCFSIQPGNTTLGGIGGKEFSVYGIRADCTEHINGGEAIAEYRISQLHEGVAEFRIHILYTFI